MIQTYDALLANVQVNAIGALVDARNCGLAAGGCALLAKIDVEGYETQVLAGAGGSLADPALRGLILELNGRP